MLLLPFYPLIRLRLLLSLPLEGEHIFLQEDFARRRLLKREPAFLRQLIDVLIGNSESHSDIAGSHYFGIFYHG